MFEGSWQTSMAGYITLLMAILVSAQCILDGMMPDVTEIMAAMVGLGLIQARDDKKSSEDVGAK